ncbi:hypothetical protein BJ742DRAFT_522243 [Cladochytrium replicatum]|nr:hypothetical protein BJ742DRAFT_522243 [Cladochytrium replicatum]
MSKLVSGDSPRTRLGAQALDPRAPKLHSRAMRRNWFAVSYAIVALASNAYDASLAWNLPLLESFKRDVSGADSWSLAQIQIATTAGSFIAPLLYIPVFDGLGRSKGVLFGTFFAFVGVCVQVFGTFGEPVEAKRAFEAGRAINQFGVAIAGVVANVYIMEISHPAWRAFFGGLFGGVWVWGYYLNQFVILLASFGPDGHWQWRGPIMLQFLWAVVLFVMYFFVPESPRWLIANGREADARNVILKWQADNDESNPMVELQMEELREIVASGPKFRYIDSINPMPLFSNSNVRRRMLILGSINWGWQVINLAPSGGQFITLIYDLLGISSPSMKQGLDIAGDVFSVAGGYLGSFGPERYGRRFLQLLGYSGAIIFLAVQAFSMHLFEASGRSFGWAVGFFVAKYLGGLWSAMVTAPSANLFVDEVMPYENRMRTYFVVQEVGSFLSFGTTVLQAKVIDWLGEYLYYWITAYGVVQLLTIYLLVPETKGRTLEQVGEIFDHPNFVEYSLKMLHHHQLHRDQDIEMDFQYLSR